MAKQQAKKKSTKPQTVTSNQLPQNILAIGDCAHEQKCVYISQSVYRQIHAFARDKTTVESGGVLMGRAIEAFGRMHVVISGFIQAKYSTATNTSLTFTHESWNYIHAQAERFPGQKIVGWIHTHPDFGVFLSENDQFIQKTVFSDENQIAYVVDPIQDAEGFFHWRNGEIEQSGGFYLYDKPGVKIASPEPGDEEEGEEEEAPKKVKKRAELPKGSTAILCWVLAVACIGLGVFCFVLNRKVARLNNRVTVLELKVQILDNNNAFSK